MVFFQWLSHNVIPLVGYTAFIGIALMLLCGGPDPAGAMPLTRDSSMAGTDRIYCSNSLSDAISMICGGRFNSYGIRFPGSVGGSRSLKGAVLKSLANRGDVLYQPLQAGPIHECCERPCGYSDLKMYCAPDP